MEAGLDSLDVPKQYWTRSWKIPGTPWNIEGYSRSAYRTGFFIKDLNLMLDAGPQRFDRPEHIMITHTHGDHIANLPFTMIGIDNAGKNYQVQLYGPNAAKQHMQNYVNVLFETNAMIDPVPQNELDQFYVYKGVVAGTSFDVMLRNERMVVEVFECDHRIPTVSYGFTQIKKKLAPQYTALKGNEIAALRQTGVDVSEDVPMKRFAYVCDTTINVFDLNPNLLTYPVIMIECTFIGNDEDETAEDKSHIYWRDLQHIVVAHPEITFMTFHFSRIYKDAEIRDFFELERNRLGIMNVYCWA